MSKGTFNVWVSSIEHWALEVRVQAVESRLRVGRAVEVKVKQSRRAVWLHGGSVWLFIRSSSQVGHSHSGGSIGCWLGVTLGVVRFVRWDRVVRFVLVGIVLFRSSVGWDASPYRVESSWQKRESKTFHTFFKLILPFPVKSVWPVSLFLDASSCRF